MKGDQSIGVKEIARKANVSIATVDRVLHNRSGVSEDTKKKINEIIKKYNYQPKEAGIAKTAKAGHFNSSGFIGNGLLASAAQWN